MTIEPLGGLPITDAGVEEFLWDRPGASNEELREGMNQEQNRALNGVLIRLISSATISGVRFQTKAPDLRTTFRYFPTSIGRIEVVNRDSMSFAYTHDPLGVWQKAMDEAD